MSWKDRAREATENFKARMAEPQAATLTISRTTSTDEEADNVIMLRVKVGVGRVADVTLTAEDFALALTGMSEVPATFRGAK